MSVQKGTIAQYRGPFPIGYTLNLEGQSPNNNCIIGISVDEKDYMSNGTPHDEDRNHTWGRLYGEDIVFTINNQQIHLGKTQMYETEQQINNTIIQFPNGAPASLKVEIVYLNPNTLEEEEEQQDE